MRVTFAFPRLHRSCLPYHGHMHAYHASIIYHPSPQHLTFPQVHEAKEVLQDVLSAQHKLRSQYEALCQAMARGLNEAARVR